MINNIPESWQNIDFYRLLSSYETAIHDLKTPMAIIYSTIQNMEESSLNTKHMAKDVHVLKKNWYRAMKLINDLNDYGKIFNGALVPKFYNYDLVQLLRDITYGANNLAKRREISVCFHSNVTRKKAATDKDMMERIVLNLLSNSIKFTPQGGVITISLIAKKNYYTIEVTDNGVGIDKKHLDFIFEKYYSQSQRANQNGSGIGLYIVKELTKILNGEISVKTNTNQDRGTTIGLKFPITVLNDDSKSIKIMDDFYADNMIQIELADNY